MACVAFGFCFIFEGQDKMSYTVRSDPVNRILTLIFFLKPLKTIREHTVWAYALSHRKSKSFSLNFHAAYLLLSYMKWTQKVKIYCILKVFVVIVTLWLLLDNWFLTFINRIQTLLYQLLILKIAKSFCDNFYKCKRRISDGNCTWYSTWDVYKRQVHVWYEILLHVNNISKLWPVSWSQLEGRHWHFMFFL